MSMKVKHLLRAVPSVTRVAIGTSLLLSPRNFFQILISDNYGFWFIFRTRWILVSCYI